MPAGSAEQTITFLGVGAKGEEVSVHNWNDRKHALTKPKRKRSDTPLHPSVQAVFAYVEKTGTVPIAGAKKAHAELAEKKEFSPKELISLLKKEFPRLHAEFGPSEAQVKNH